MAAQADRAADWEWIGLEITDAGPEPLPSDPILKDGSCIGYVTSATQGYRPGKTLVLGYAQRGQLSLGDGCKVRILGQDRSAFRHNPHVYDPENHRLKS